MERIIEIPEGYEARIEGDKVVLEPKESEDERIRKWLIEMVEELRKANPTNAEHNGNCSEAIAYLEKQKEQKPSQYDIDILEKHITKDSISELAHTVIIRNGWEIVEKDLKPTEWSGEDEVRKNAIANWLAAQGNAKYSGFYAFQLIDWLNSLRPQPKQDVSPSLREKEVICLKRALDYLRKEHNRYGGEDFTNEIAVLEWLITHPILVSDTHWKPSEEQLQALWRVVEYLDESDNEDFDIIENLYSELTELM